METSVYRFHKEWCDVLGVYIRTWLYPFHESRIPLAWVLFLSKVSAINTLLVESLEQI